MIIAKTEPYTKEEIGKLKECFDVYIKTVIDLKRKVCAAGVGRHFEGEKILLEQGSSQSDIWGGGIDLETKTVDYNSLINIRLSQKNSSNEILDPVVRRKFEDLTKYFFVEVV